jgi:hypothetical protein
MKDSDQLHFTGHFTSSELVPGLHRVHGKPDPTADLEEASALVKSVFPFVTFTLLTAYPRAFIIIVFVAVFDISSRQMWFKHNDLWTPICVLSRIETG